MTDRPPSRIVFADANVLYTNALRDILIELALADVLTLHWSPAVLDELVRALVRNRTDYSPEKGNRLVTAMNAVLPAALVIPSGAGQPPTSLPDPTDVHILDAAIHAECNVILTFNLKHFPAASLLAHKPLETTHPDDFFIRLLSTQAAAVLPVIDAVRQNLTRPPMSVGAYTDSLARSNLPRTAELLRHLLPT